MLGENKNIKDTPKDSLKDTSSMSIPSADSRTSLPATWSNNSVYYNRANKLITALYMVTDIMDKDEPIRLKLRTLGADILSDSISLLKVNTDLLDEKMTVVLSFINIASDLNMISGMNASILKKEFLELKQSIQELNKKNNLWLEDFMLSPSKNSNEVDSISNTSNPSIGHDEFTNKNKPSFYKGHSNSIGVQKGSTLLSALGKVGGKNTPQLIGGDSFEILKNKRREEIISIIKEKKETAAVGASSEQIGATITDIKNRAKGTLVSCGEKTLQRELVSMVSDNILYRTGSKRWSHYFLK